MNSKDMLIKGLTNHLLTSLKYYLWLSRAEILSVFASGSTKFKAIKHFAFHCCIKGIKKWGNENNPLLLMFIRFTKTVHIFLRKSINLVLVSNRLNIH